MIGRCRTRRGRPAPLRGRILVALALALAPVTPAGAAHEPIPEGPDAATLPAFTGAAAVPRPVYAPEPPQHPFLAGNGLSNLHVDGWQTDRNTWFGPLGGDVRRTSTFQGADCASHTFDRRERVVSVCVGLQGPRLMLFAPDTLHELARMDLPPRQPQAEGSPNPFTNFSGGGYFVLDERDRAIVPTTTRHILEVAVQDPPGFAVERDHDLGAFVPPGDAIISALPDWSGRLWFVSVAGVLGTIDRRDGSVAAIELGEPVSNSFAVAEEGEVYVVSDRALYRFAAGPDGTPRAQWRHEYANDGRLKPGQTQAGSGTTPSVMSREHLTITDNADPINVVVLERGSGRVVCSAPVFAAGAGATDNSLIVTPRSIVVENNHGYTGPASTEGGRSTVGGVERVDVTPDGRCRTVWRNPTRAPTSVPKLSLAAGLVYVYEKEAREDRIDAWYLTAIDFHDGRTVYRRLAGEGLGFNNNYAPITLGPRGDAFVGTLGGLVRLADAEPPGNRPLRVRLLVRHRRGPGGCVRGAARARLAGPDRPAARRVGFRLAGRRIALDREPPFRVRIAPSRLREVRPVTLRAVVRSGDGRVARPVRLLRACRR